MQLVRLKEFVKRSNVPVSRAKIYKWISQKRELPFIVRVGKLIYIDPVKFEKWLEKSGDFKIK